MLLRIASPNLIFLTFLVGKAMSLLFAILLVFACGCCPACNAPCICMAVGMISRLFTFVFFFNFFLGPLCGAPNAPQIIFHEGGLFIAYGKNVVIKEALAFERPAFCDFPLKNCFHLISYLDFIAFMSCFVLVKHGLQCEPNGFSIESLCGSDVLPRCN